MSNNPLNNLGPVIAEALKQEGISENQASLTTGISRQTLRRRLTAGNLTAAELGALAHILNIDPDELVARSIRSAA